MTFFHIIAQHCQYFRENQYDIIVNEETKQRAKEYLMTCNPFQKPFYELFMVDNTAGRYLPLKDAYDSIVMYARDTLLYEREERKELSMENFKVFLKERNIPMEGNHIKGYNYIIAHQGILYMDNDD